MLIPVIKLNKMDQTSSTFRASYKPRHQRQFSTQRPQPLNNIHPFVSHDQSTAPTPSPLGETALLFFDKGLPTSPKVRKLNAASAMMDPILPKGGVYPGNQSREWQELQAKQDSIWIKMKSGEQTSVLQEIERQLPRGAKHGQGTRFLSPQPVYTQSNNPTGIQLKMRLMNAGHHLQDRHRQSPMVVPHGLSGSHHSSFQQRGGSDAEDENAPFKNSMIKEQMTQIRVKGDSIMQLLASSSAQKRPKVVGDVTMYTERQEIPLKQENSPDSTGSSKKKVLMKYYGSNTHSGFYSPTNNDKKAAIQDQQEMQKPEELSFDKAEIGTALQSTRQSQAPAKEVEAPVPLRAQRKYQPNPAKYIRQFQIQLPTIQHQRDGQNVTPLSIITPDTNPLKQFSSLELDSQITPLPLQTPGGRHFNFDKIQQKSSLIKYDQNGRRVFDNTTLPYNSTMRAKFNRGDTVSFRLNGPQNVEPKAPNRLFNKELISSVLQEKALMGTPPDTARQQQLDEDIKRVSKLMMAKRSPKQRSKTTLKSRGITIVSPSMKGTHQSVIMRYIEENRNSMAKLIIHEQEGHIAAQLNNTAQTWDKQVKNEIQVTGSNFYVDQIRQALTHKQQVSPRQLKETQNIPLSFGKANMFSKQTSASGLSPGQRSPHSNASPTQSPQNSARKLLALSPSFANNDSFPFKLSSPVSQTKMLSHQDSKIKLSAFQKRESLIKLSPSHQNTPTIYTQITTNAHQKYDDAINNLRLKKNPPGTLTDSKARLETFQKTVKDQNDEHIPMLRKELSTYRKPIKKELESHGRHMGVSGLGFYQTTLSPQVGAHVVVIKKGKLYHRHLLDEFVISDNDLFKITQKQRVVFKVLEKNPLANIISQSAESVAPLWHNLEKILRNHSNLYNQVVAITDVTPAQQHVGYHQAVFKVNLADRRVLKARWINPRQEPSLVNEEMRLAMQRQLYRSQVFQLLSNGIEEEIIEIDEKKHALISYLILYRSQDTFEQQFHRWRDPQLRVKHRDTYSPQKLLNILIQCVKLFERLHYNLGGYFTGQVPIQRLLCLDYLTHEVNCNVEALVTSESADQLDILLRIQPVANSVKLTLADKHDPNKKRPSNLQLSHSLKAQHHSETVVLNQEELIKYERQTLSALLKKAYAMGEKFTVLERLFEDLDVQETQVVLLRYENELQQMDGYIWPLCNQLIAEYRSHLVIAVLDFFRPYQHLIAKLDSGQRLTPDPVTSPMKHGGVQACTNQRLVLLLLRSSQDASLRRRLIYQSEPQLFRIQEVLDPVNTPFSEFNDIQEKIDLVDVASCDQSAVSSPQTLEITQAYLDCLEFVSYRPNTYPGQSELLGKLHLRHRNSPVDEARVLEAQLKCMRGQFYVQIELCDRLLALYKRLGSTFTKQEALIAIEKGRCILQIFDRKDPNSLVLLEQIVQTYSDSVLEHFSTYSSEWMFMLDFKYHTSQHRKDMQLAFEACEQSFRVTRILLGEAHHQTMCAFFRLSVIRSKIMQQQSGAISIQNESLQLPVDYPRLKITHPAVFRVLIPIYTEETAKLNELLQVIYTQPAPTQRDHIALHTQLAIATDDILTTIMKSKPPQYLLQLTGATAQPFFELSESDHKEVMHHLLVTCMSERLYIEGVNYARVLSYITRHGPLLQGGERNKVEKAESALRALVDYQDRSLQYEYV